MSEDLVLKNILFFHVSINLYYLVVYPIIFPINVWISFKNTKPSLNFEIIRWWKITQNFFLLPFCNKVSFSPYYFVCLGLLYYSSENYEASFYYSYSPKESLFWLWLLRLRFIWYSSSSFSSFLSTLGCFGSFFSFLKMF